MKNLLIAVTISIFSLCSIQTLARDTKHMYPLSDALNTEDAHEKLNEGIKFFFGDQKPDSIARSLGSFTSNRKTNAFNKSDKEACEWAFLSAMLALQSRAKQQGGNAIIIHSYYRRNTVKSDTEYECGAGTFVAGVTLVGKVVKLNDQAS